MPKKKENKRTRRVVVQGERRIDVVKFCAFWGILLSAVLYLVSGILGFVVTGTLINVIKLIAALALLVGVAFPAYNYVRGKRRIWKIIYWIILVVYIAGCVLCLF